MNSALVAVALCLIAVIAGAVSPRSGLNWECWAAFVIYNVGESWVQAVVRGLNVNKDAPLMKSLIAQHVVTMNLPVLSPRVDLVKDLIFTTTCSTRGAKTLAVLSALVCLVNVERQWSVPRLRREVREEELPLLKPKDDIDARDVNASAGLTRLIMSKALNTARDMSMPLKIETALWEDIPQTMLQIMFMLIYGGSMVTQISILIGLVKIVIIVVMPPLILDKTELKLVYAARHVASSPLAQNRKKAVASFGRWLDAVPSESKGAVPGAVRALGEALRNDTDFVVRLASAEVIIRHTKLICIVDPHLARCAEEAVNFVGDNEEELGDMAKDRFTIVVPFLWDEEIATTCVYSALVKLAKALARLIDKPLVLSAMVAVHKGYIGGSCLVRPMCRVVLSSLADEDIDEECQALASAIEALFEGKHDGGDKLVELAIGGPPELREHGIQVAAQGCDDTNGRARVQAARAFFEIKGAEISSEGRQATLDTLKKAVEDQDAEVRCAAIVSLGTIGSSMEIPQDVVVVVAQGLKDEEKEVRCVAVTALGGIGCATQLPHDVMISVAQASEDTDKLVRCAAIQAAGLLDKSLDSLLKFKMAYTGGTSSTDIAIIGAYVAANRLSDLGPRPQELIDKCVKDLSTHPDWKRRVVAASSIGLAAKGMGGASVEGQPLKSLLKALAEDRVGEVHRACADALGFCSSSAETNTALRTAAKWDRQGSVRAAARRALKTVAPSTSPKVDGASQK